MDDLRLAFGRRVRALREKLALSQEQLAERAQLHWTYISGIERGKRNPGLSTLARLANALEVPLTKLVADLQAQPPGRRDIIRTHRTRTLRR